MPWLIDALVPCEHARGETGLPHSESFASGPAHAAEGERLCSESTVAASSSVANDAVEAINWME